MFKRYWIVFLTIVGLTLSVGPYGYAQQEAAQTDNAPTIEQEATPELPAPLPVIIVEEDEAASARQSREEIADKNQSDDLIAQQRMAEATEAMNWATQRMMWASWFSAILVFVGTALLFWTLWLTRKATGAAQAAVTVTEKMGINQSQAYVHVEAADIEVGNDTMKHPRVILYVSNTGNTPAKNFKLSINSYTVEKSGDNPLPEPVIGQSESTLPLRWNALGANKGSSMALQPKTLQQDVRIVRESQADMRLYITGSIIYETFFGSVYRTEFAFFLAGITPFRRELIREIDGVKVYQEIPMKMSQPNNNALASYQLQPEEEDA